jgi:hypothetical protein
MSITPSWLKGAILPQSNDHVTTGPGEDLRSRHDGAGRGLTDDLRAELGAEVITDGFVWLHIDRKGDPSEEAERGTPRAATNRTT